METTILNIENQLYQNFRNFLTSNRFRKILWNIIKENPLLSNNENLPKILDKFIKKENLENSDFLILNLLFQYDKFFIWLKENLNNNDIKYLSEQVNITEDRFPWTKLTEREEYNLKVEKIINSFINFILNELKLRKINQLINDIKYTFEWLLEEKIIFSWKRYEIIGTWKYCFLYDKSLKNIIWKCLVWEWDKKIAWNFSKINHQIDIYKTSNWDYLTEIWEYGDLKSLISIKTWEILTPEYKVLYWVKEIKWKTIISFNSEWEQKHFCVETQQYFNLLWDWGDWENLLIYSEKQELLHEEDKAFVNLLWDWGDWEKFLEKLLIDSEKTKIIT
jgi:hypothetical protein